MKMLPKNIEEDHYLGKGTEYLKLALFLILLIISVITFGLFFTDFTIDIGSLLSGTIGVIVALLVAIFTFLAFYVQYDANKKIQAQFHVQSTTEHFYKMLDIHVSNVENFSFISHRSDRDNVTYNLSNYEDKGREFHEVLDILIGSLSFDFETKKLLNNKQVLNEFNSVKITTSDDFKSIENRLNGRKIFLLIEKDFHFTHHMVSLVNDQFLNNELKVYQVNELAYKIFFWGTDSNNIYGSEIKSSDVDFITSFLNQLRIKIRKNKGQKVLFKYKTHQKIREVYFRFIPFSGHASRLAHYYRHLYQTVKFLNISFEKKLVTIEQLDNMLNTLRAQLSNEEVLLLYYNYRIGFGSNWDYMGDNNYQFLTEFRMLHNIPLTNNIPESIEDPEVHFVRYIAKQTIRYKKFEHFEWGSELSYFSILEKISKHYILSKNEKFLKLEAESLKQMIEKIVTELIKDKFGSLTQVQISFCDDLKIDFSQMFEKVYLIDLGNFYRIKAIYAIDVIKLKNDTDFQKDENLKHYIIRRLKTDVEIYKLKDFQ